MNVKHFILTTLLPPASLTILYQECPFSNISLLQRLLWRIIAHFPDGTSCFAPLFVCLKNPATNNTKMTKNKIISTWKHSWLKNKLSTSHTQQKDCWLFHSAGILYKITYIPTSNKMSLHFTNILQISQLKCHVNFVLSSSACFDHYYF